MKLISALIVVAISSSLFSVSDCTERGIIDSIIKSVKYRLDIAAFLAKNKAAKGLAWEDWFKVVGKKMVEDVMVTAKEKGLDVEYADKFFTAIMESCETVQKGLRQDPEFLEIVPSMGDDPDANLEELRNKIRSFNKRMVKKLVKFMEGTDAEKGEECHQKVNEAIQIQIEKKKAVFIVEAFEHVLEKLCPPHAENADHHSIGDNENDDD